MASRPSDYELPAEVVRFQWSNDVSGKPSFTAADLRAARPGRPGLNGLGQIEARTIRGSMAPNESVAGRPWTQERPARLLGDAGRPCLNEVTVGMQIGTVCHRRAV